MSNNDEQEMISLTDILNELFEQKNILLTEKYVGNEVFVQSRKEAFSKLKKRFSKTVSLLSKMNAEKEKQYEKFFAGLDSLDLIDRYNSMVDYFSQVDYFEFDEKPTEEVKRYLVNEIIKMKMQESNENIAVTKAFSKSFDQNNKSHYFDKLTSKEMVKFMLLKEDVIVEMNPEYKVPFSKFINLKFSELSSLEWIYLINAFQQQLSNSTGQVQEKEEAFNHFIESFRLAPYVVLADINLKFNLKSFSEASAIVPSAINFIEEFGNAVSPTLLKSLTESYLSSYLNIQDIYIQSAIKFQRDEELSIEPFFNLPSSEHSLLTIDQKDLVDSDNNNLLLNAEQKILTDKVVLITALKQFTKNYVLKETNKTLEYFLDNEAVDNIINYALTLLKNNNIK